MQNQENSLLHIHHTWTDAQRRTIWCLICKAREGLEVELDPIVATAFVILQRYFRGDKDCPYDLFVIMVAALFTACKQTDTYRPLRAIYNELFDTCRKAPSKMIRGILGPRIDSSTMDSTDLILITNAEMDLLQATGFDFSIDLPFKYAQQIKDIMASSLPPEIIEKIYKSIIIDLCLLICSQYYLDVPPEVCVAVATEQTCTSFDTTGWVDLYIGNVQNKYGQNVYSLAKSAFEFEKQRTMRPRAPTQQPVHVQC